jgi:hypothetical protein
VGRRGEALLSAAPIGIGNTDHVAAALVRRNANATRMYVHEVSVRAKLHDVAFKTGASAEAVGRPARIMELFVLCSSGSSAVKRATSKIVDAAGRPLVLDRDTHTGVADLRDSGILHGPFGSGISLRREPWWFGSRAGVSQSAAPSDYRRRLHRVGRADEAEIQKLKAAGCDGVMNAAKIEIVGFSPSRSRALSRTVAFGSRGGR